MTKVEILLAAYEVRLKTIRDFLKLGDPGEKNRCMLETQVSMMEEVIEFLTEERNDLN